MGELATRLPRVLTEIDGRVSRLIDDISAMRAAVEPLDMRMQQLEGEMRGMHKSLKDGMQATEDGMKETARLQDVTNQGIGDLVENTEPLSGDINRVEGNTSPLPDRIGTLEQLMASMLQELKALRESLEPVSAAAEPVARLRERLPGGN